MNARLEKAAQQYMSLVGCSEEKARRLVREAVGARETLDPTRTPKRDRRARHGANGTAPAAAAASAGGAKTDKAHEAAVILDEHGLDGYVREYRFHPVRRWRLDFYWPDSRVALEIEGRLPPWMVGNQVSHHTSWSGYENDAEKYSEAAVARIRVIRCTEGMMRDGRMVDLVGRALCGETNWKERDHL